MFKIRVRVIVGVMMFLGYFLTYIVRYNLSVHILDMAQVYKMTTFENSSAIARTDHVRSRMNLMNLISWDDVKIAQLFAAYHIGYCICFPIFHNLGDRLGPTWVICIAGIVSGVLNCLTPVAAYQDFWSFFATRIFTGFCSGAMQPSMVQVLRHWVPPVERNHFMWAYCGITTGTFSTFLICAAVHYYCRWTVGFYVIGGVQVAWAALWITIVSDYPAKHPFISTHELAYLNNTIGNSTIYTIKFTNTQAPWGLILKSVPFWALCILNFGYAWMIISFCIHGPFFYTRVVNYSIYNASAMSALPFMLRLILGTVVIQTFHWYKHISKRKRIKNIRKYCIIVSHVIPGMLISSTWLSSVVPGPILLTLAIVLTAAGMDLTLDLGYELSPTYGNSINTVIKMIGNVPGIIVSLTVGHVTQKYKNTANVWKHIWCFHASVLWISGVVFLIWGETQVQPWNAVHRPRRVIHPKIRSSAMSNIIEVEEEEIASKTPNNDKKTRSSFLYRGPFKISQGNV